DNDGENSGTEPAPPIDAKPQRNLLVNYLGLEGGLAGPKVHLFKVFYEDDLSGAPNIEVRVSSLSGLAILEPLSLNPKEVFVSDSEGYFRISLSFNPQNSTQSVQCQPKDSQSFSFEITETYQLVLSASRNELNYLEPTSTSFNLTVDSRPLEAGTIVNLSSNEGCLANLPSEAVVNQLGQIVAENLTIVQAPLGCSVRAMVLNLTSNSIVINPILSEGGLTLVASVSSLDFLRAKSVTLALYYQGRALPMGTKANFSADSLKIGNLPQEVTLGLNGSFLANLTALIDQGPLTISAQALGLNSNVVEFSVFFDYSSLTLQASVNQLEYLTPTAVTFTVLFDNRALPEGIKLRVYQAGESLEGLNQEEFTRAGGTFSLSALKALSYQSSSRVYVSVGSLTSNEVSFDLFMDSSLLAFSADSANLELFNPKRVVFTFYYRGQSLPQSTLVSLSALSQGELENLPSQTQTNGAGQVAVENLTAIKVTSTPTVQGRLGIYLAGEASFTVEVNMSNISSSLFVSPQIDITGVDVVGKDPPYIRPCNNFEVELELKYLGKPLSNQVVSLSGLGFSPLNSVTTNSSGKLIFNVIYDMSDFDYFLQNQGNYSLTIGSASKIIPGPSPIGIYACP
ncbi:MAG: hypothetical protein LBV23_01830, partial [Deltaproteobacteria bacterium]|nr:hypothetical protein [Deltaproteobacteria bacterium]